MQGLLLAAVLAPLGRDAVAAAFIVGFVLRGSADRPGPRVAAPIAGWLFSALVIASFAGGGYQPDGFAAGVRYILGFALTAATVRLFRQHPAVSIDLPKAMTAAGCVTVLQTVVGASPIDLRASAACFALVACLAIGMAARSLGRARLAWATASLWLIAGVVFAVVRSPDIAAGFSRTAPLIAATLRLLGDRPLFGVGIGLDAATAPLFYSPPLSWNGGALGTHNLLVIANELGLVGLALWSVWIGAGLLRAARALAIDPRDTRLWGATIGVAAFVASLAVGRPLAFSETVFPFAFQFGLMAAMAGSTLLDTTPRRTRHPRGQVAVTAVGMAAIAAGALVSARRGPIEPPASETVDGYGSFFVREDVRNVQLPLRAAAAPSGAPVFVDIKVDGGEPQSTTVGDFWQVVNIALPESSSIGHFHRIDVKMREQGVEFGELRIAPDR